MKELLDNYGNAFGEQFFSIHDIMTDMAYKICNTIDDELCGLQEMVADNTSSTYDISQKIDEIRRMMY